MTGLDGLFVIAGNRPFNKGNVTQEKVRLADSGDLQGQGVIANFLSPSSHDG